jgi:flagellar hook-associated protein 1 FlgK
MADISRVLFTAKQALLSNLTAINVTGSNIANVNTAGYSRLRPIFESVGTKDSSSAQEQIGVRIADIEQVYDRFLQYQLVQQQSAVANYTAQQDLLQRVEGVLNENNGSGINDALGEFLNAWGNLSIDPSSKSKRDMVVSTGENLAYVFNQRAGELKDIQMAADDSVADTISILNGYLTQMASFNQIIVNAEMAGSSASSVRDQRGELLSDISQLIDINYIEKSDGSLYIWLPTNGKALVEGFNSWNLEVKRNIDNDNLYDIVFSEDPTKSINGQITGGKLAGILEVRDTKIPSYLDELNQTASSLINKVNDLHMSSYDQDGNPGGAFFNATDEARYMQVSDAIVADTRKIAASATVNADGNNATAIATITNDQMYASLGPILSADASPVATASILIPASLGADGSIVLTRGATAADWTVTTSTGYANMNIISATATTITIDADSTALPNTGDITLTLSGTWESGDTAAFTITAAGPTVSAVTPTDDDIGASQDHSATGQINNIGQVYKDTLSGHPITITRGAASDTWTIADNGGYENLNILSADSQSVSIDLDDNGTADITMSLSGNWEQNDTLSFRLIKNDSTTTVDGYFNAMIANMGQDVVNATRALDRETTILNQQKDQREQLSGVSVDEEMINLIKYQMAYGAAGRMTKTVSDMMDIIINLGR